MAEEKKKKNFFTRLWDNKAEIGKGLLRIVPGAKVAEGIGYGLSQSYTEKIQNDIQKKQDQLTLNIVNKIKNTDDEEKKERYKNILKNMGTENAIESSLEEAPTTGQIIASGVELAATAAMAYKPSMAGTTGKLLSPSQSKAFSSVAKLNKQISLSQAGLAKKTFETVAKPILKGAGEGALFFGLGEAALNKDATLNTIIAEAEKGAKFGGILTAAGKVAGEMTDVYRKVIGPKVNRKWNDTIKKLENIATEAPKISDDASQSEKVLNSIGQGKKSLKQRLAKGVVDINKSWNKLESRMIDKFAPFKRIENKIIDYTNAPITKENEKIYRDARLLSSVSDYKAEAYVDDLAKKLDPYTDIRDKYTAYLTQLDYMDRAKLGNKVPTGQSWDELVDGFQQMTREYGDDMDRIGDVRKIMQEYNVKLLDERIASGLINEQTKNKLLATHPNYIPHDVMKYVEQNAIDGLSASMNVSKTDIKRAIGSLDNIKDPVAATMSRTQVATRLMEKNKLLNNVVDLSKKYGDDIFPGMKRIQTNMKPESGFDVINLFRNGQSERWQVPSDLAVAIKNLDTPVTPGWYRVLTSPQRALKKFATQYNLSFAIPNKFRDQQTAALTSQAFIDDLARRYGTKFDDVSFAADDIKRLYKESGGYGASIFKDGDASIIDDLAKGTATKKLDKINPAKIVENINESFEQSTRMGVFRKALENGLSPKDAALVSREATIDFAKMGSWMKPANQAIPFLNARVQGFVNLPKALASNPEAFTRMQMLTSVYPTLLLQKHNRRYDSYKNISQYFKNKYWIIMTGEVDGIDSYTGEQIKVPQFVTITKGEGQALVSGPIQYFLDKQDKNDFRTGTEMLVDTLGAASPLEFQSFDQSNFWLTAASQGGPVPTIATGLGTNINPYFGSSIVPESRTEAKPSLQFSRGTADTLKDLSSILSEQGVEISPAQVQFVLESFGGVPKDINNALDIIYGAITDEDKDLKSISGTDFGELSKIPIFRRFLRETTESQSPETEFRKEQKEEITEKYKSEKLLLYDKAEDVWRKINKMENKEERLNYLNGLGDELTPELVDRLEYIKKYRGGLESLKTTDPVDVRAEYITMRLEEMYLEGKSESDRMNFLIEAEQKGILSKSVKKRIAELKAELKD